MDGCDILGGVDRRIAISGMVGVLLSECYTHVSMVLMVLGLVMGRVQKICGPEVSRSRSPHVLLTSGVPVRTNHVETGGDGGIKLGEHKVQKVVRRGREERDQ